ncbi:MAG TPA: sulfocyanin-like copper-binding protein [Candidatus Dormibacteraeota bacterium]
MRGAGPAPNQPPRRRRWGRRAQLGVIGASSAIALLLAGCGSNPLSSADSGVGCSVTVLIPSLGSSLLGAVQAKVGGRVYQLKRNVNTVAVACGDRATVSARATDPAQHPFTGWSTNGVASSASTLTVTVNGLLSVRPRFLLPRAPATPSPSPTPKATPSATAAPVALDQWVSYDAASKTVTWKVVAAYQGVNHGLSFDGEADGAMKLTVPRGWTVTVDFSNVGTTNHSAVIVTSTGMTPVFAGAETPSPMNGTAPGQTASFTFSASQTGSYRLACLMPGHEAAGMWETFTVSSGGLPSVQL